MRLWPKRVWIGLLFVFSTFAAAPVKTVGKYEITLRVPAQGLYAREEQEIELHIADATRPDPLTGFAPVIRAVVEARIDMPTMPSMPAYVETAHPEGVPGDYGVHPTFAHGGEYRLRLAVRPPGDRPFEVEFALEVADEPVQGVRRVQPRYSVELTSTPKRPKAGEVAELRFVFRDRERPKSIVSAFETVHEALFHLIAVRSDLSLFAHEHPEKQPDGSFVWRYRFAAGGEYRLFADVAPVGAGSQILTAKIAVSGPPAEMFRITTADRKMIRTIDGATKVAIDGIDISTPLPIRKTIPIAVRILDAASGKTVSDLEAYLGVKGHFLLVHEDAVTFVHSHPAGNDESGEGSLRFLARFPKPGLYRGWVQVKRGGRILTADFILQAGVAP